MKKFMIILAAIALLLPVYSHADEGMWMVHNFEKNIYPQMVKKGFKLKSNEIYNEESGNALANAVVSLDFGCTGSMISKNGLLITNHHCAYGDIHALSTNENNYLENGFWAMSNKDEMPVKGKKIQFLRKVLDVTDEVRAIKDSLTKQGFGGMMMRRTYRIIELKYSKTTDYMVSCASMWSGEKYYMFFYEEYKDIRLVGAPPVSIGAFGGETDNWGWPQHKGDFALYRVYTGPDGKPAEYSPENVPMQPKRILPISTKGVHPGDYAMIMGYPGRTNRYASSFEISEKENITNPIIVASRRSKLDVWKKHMDKDPKIRLLYADKYFGISNYADYAKWENICLRRYDVADIRAEEEKHLQEKYGNLLAQMKEAYTINQDHIRNKTWYKECFNAPCDWLATARRVLSVARDMNKQKIEKIDKNHPLMKKYLAAFKRDFTKFDITTDRELFGAQLHLFINNIDPKYCSDTMKAWMKEFNLNGAALAEYIYTNSYLSTVEKAEEFFSTPRTAEEILDDPINQYLESCSIMTFNKEADNFEKKCGYCPNKSYTRYAKALYESRKERGIAQYPNANSTMRFTYGTVGGIKPADGITYDYQTSIVGYTEKEDPANYEFNVNDKMKSLIASKDWGRWGEKGNLYVNFLTDNDITGGNSGSPVINGKGEIIGLAFDGNRESMSGDVYFHARYFKTVCVDIRFVLWVIEKYGEASHLIKEMELK